MVGAVALGRFLARGFRASLRCLVAAILAASVFSLSSSPAAFAAGGVIGSLTGTVVDSSTQAPISGATVAVTSASNKYQTTTDGSGKFGIVGMSVDTYSLSITAPGHETQVIPGITVVGDQSTSAGTIALATRLSTIGRVAARSVSNAFQPSQTTDSYTINAAQIIQSTGKAYSTNENAALLSVPGVTLTNNNTPSSSQVTIRGGAAFEVGYQFDGVPLREPFLNGNGTFGLMNGVGNVQVVEGASDATQAGVGAGVINVVPVRGSGPGSGSIDLELGGPNMNHQYGANYGFSTPDNRISESLSYTGQYYAPYNGYNFTNQQQYGNYFSTNTVKNDQIVNNFFFKFGKDLNQQVQVLYMNVSQQGWQGVTGCGGVYNQATNPCAFAYYPYDTLTQGILAGDLLGYTPAEYASLIGIPNTVPTSNVPVPGPQQNFSNQTRFLKIEYDNNLSSNTYLALRYYNWAGLESTDDSYTLGTWNTGFPGISAPTTTGGQTTGVNLDIVHSFAPNLTVSLNGQYDVLAPIFDTYESQIQGIALAFGTGLANQPTAADWLPGGYVYTNFCGNTPWSGTGPAPSCLPRIPAWGIGYNGTIFHNWGTGIRFQYNPFTALKMDLGVRIEGQDQTWFSQIGNLGQGAPATGQCSGLGSNYCSVVGAGGTIPILSPFDVQNFAWTNQVLKPHVTEPRGSISYQFDPDDSVRFSYGRSAVFADAQTAGTPFELYGLQTYLKLPALPGSTCGWTASTTFPCQSYGAQLYWMGDNEEAPDAGNGLPALYNNYDASYNHLFANGLGMRITGFAKQGTDLPTFFLLNPVLGIFAVDNQGLNKTAGAEFDLTTRQRTQGLSGFFAATYQNVLTTTPPFTTAENAVPLVNIASLNLGDLYRAGYVSPASFRIGAVYNFKNGFSVNAQLETNIGYPYSIGNTIAGQLANGSYANIPQVDFGPGITGGNASLIGGSPGAAVSTNYYDPSYPGSATAPNIAATRGTNATASNGGYLSHWNADLALTLQYKWQRSTIGIQFLNLFGNGYANSVPSISPWYQPVATGLSGPQTGYESCTNQVGAGVRGCQAIVPNDAQAFSNGSYLLTNGNFTSGVPTLGPGAPTSIQVFYQLAL
jgi:hypothetical protein